MSQYKLANNVLGWIVFAIAAFTYCSTVEPTASFWDCPEFITTAFKLEVGHPPGAPFFMLMGNLFTQFTDDPSKVALMVNIMSALLSALCILFLFWTITHLARQLVCENGVVRSAWETIVILGCGATGALAYTWSDTFWFSAVEGEVYAFSSMFTALVFWLILKWEDHADEPGSDRWLVLIFYLVGLSIGVHLLNLLCLPAIALVYYYKKNPNAQLKGSVVALCVSALLVVAVLYGVVPGLVKVGGWFELFFVNTLGMGFNMGMVIYLVVLVAVVLGAVWSTLQKDRTLMKVLYTLSVALLGIPFIGSGFVGFVLGLIFLGLLFYALGYKTKAGEYLLRKRFLNTSLLCMLMLMIGYSSYSVIMIRSAANPPMDQNSPEDIFTLGSYLSRDQYGYRPLAYGQAYTSQPLQMGKKEQVQRHEKQNPAEPDRYDEVEVNDNYVFAPETKMLFPRMYSRLHAEQYEQWLGGIDLHPVSFTFEDEQGALHGPFAGQMPSKWDNLRFLFSYQINFMYWRYFMWNFAGRQNDIQGFGEPDHGNWITGISFIDNALYGDQSLLPDSLKNNKGHNVFYCLPLLLGLLGLFWQAYRGDKGVKQFWVVFFLFFMTGLAIVLYLNQTPSQPRERDYAYAGSFYAFAIWIGLGVAALAEGLKKVIKGNAAIPAVVASLIGLIVPVQMVSQTWDDHDRSDRYACRDFGANYLYSLPEDGAPVIFTNGDNDTFPLWYAQEVEGIRRDTRVCNLSYLQTDWYTDQMRRPAYESPSLPITWERYEYVDNMGREFFPVTPEKEDELQAYKEAHPQQNVHDLKFLINEFARKKGYIPTDYAIVPVNKENVRKSGMMIPEGMEIPDSITIDFTGKGSITKSEMMIYEMLASSDWKRPLYMSVTLGMDYYAGLEDYLVLEGLAYRITPFKVGKGTIDAEKMYHNMVERFKYGNVNVPHIYLDETNMRMCRTHRHMLNVLARELRDKGETAKAIKTMQLSEKMLPFTTIPFDPTDGEMAQIWASLGQKAKAQQIATMALDYAKKYITWANSYIGDFNPSRINMVQQDLAQSVILLNNAVRVLKDVKAGNAGMAETELKALSQTPAGSAGMQLLYNSQQEQATEEQAPAAAPAAAPEQNPLGL